MLEGDGDTLIVPPSPFASPNPEATMGTMGETPFNSELEVISESSNRASMGMLRLYDKNLLILYNISATVYLVYGFLILLFQWLCDFILQTQVRNYNLIILYMHLQLYNLLQNQTLPFLFC